MRRSFSRHDSFFSSLSQVEKRLASEEAEEAEPSSFSSSSSSPLFLLSNNPEPIHHQATANTGTGSSEPPLDFLSNSPTNTTQFQQQQQEAPDDDDDDDDDIDQLVSLLGLSLPPNQNDHYSSSCDCSCSQGGGGGGGFFRKVVGVKGPRCGKEMERLDAWIRTLHSSKSRREPARLAHLLLGKAAALASDDGTDGFGAVGFPATVHDFLDHDPPPRGGKEE